MALLDQCPVRGLNCCLIGIRSDSEYCVVILVIHGAESVMRAVDCLGIDIPEPGMSAESGLPRLHDMLVSATE